MPPQNTHTPKVIEILSIYGEANMVVRIQHLSNASTLSGYKIPKTNTTAGRMSVD